jgi:photosystem II stability/assembly factor-like uncharacterized protein
MTAMKTTRIVALFVVLAGLAAGAVLPASAATARPAPWLPATPPGGEVPALAQAPSAPAIVYAGTATAGVFRSDDGGATWTPRNATLAPGDYAIVGLAVHPQDPDTVFALPLAGPQTHSLERSRDGGLTWQPLDFNTDAGFPAPSSANGAPVRQVTFDARRAATLFAATDDGLFVSPDLGDSWSRLAFGGNIVTAVAADPSRPYVLTAIVQTVQTDQTDPTAAFQIWRSTDRGATWQLTALSGASLNSLQTDPTHAGVFYVLDAAAIYRSRDDGATWTALGGWDAARHPLALAVTPSGVLLVVVENGILTSGDGGLTFSPVAAPPADALDTLLASGADPRSILAGGFTGAWRSTDGGDTWSPSSRGLRASKPVAITVDAAGDLYCRDRGRILRSTDRGAHWTLQSTGGPLSGSPGLLAADPIQPGVLYLTDVTDSLQVSRDGGRTFTSIAPFAPPMYLDLTAFAIDPRTPDTLYLSGTSFVGLGHDQETYTATSRDGGHTWRPLAAPRDRPFVLLSIDPTQTSTLYGARTDGTLWRSVDSARTWAQVGAGLPPFTFVSDTAPLPISSLAVDPTNSRVVYAGTGGHGVYRSSDRGLHFVSFNAGLPSTATVSSVLLDARRPGLLLADAAADGVFRWQAAAESWQRLDGLPLHPDTILRVDGTYGDTAGGNGDPAADGPLAFDGQADILYALSEQGIYRLAAPDRS